MVKFRDSEIRTNNIRLSGWFLSMEGGGGWVVVVGGIDLVFRNKKPPRMSEKKQRTVQRNGDLSIDTKGNK